MPHIYASSILYLNRKYISQDKKHYIFAALLYLFIYVLIGVLLGYFNITTAIVTVYTAFHVVGQQVGISFSRDQEKNCIIQLWKWGSCFSLIPIFAFYYHRVFFEGVKVEYLTGGILVIFIMHFLLALIALRSVTQRKMYIYTNLYIWSGLLFLLARLSFSFISLPKGYT